MSNIQETTSPQHRYCRNCHYPLPHYGDFCNHCGQKHGPLKVKLWQLVQELLESVVNFDSRFLRTLGALFRPGHLTEAYFLGRRQRYVMPLRIFFLTAVLHFAIINFLLKDGIADGLSEIDVDRQAYYTLFMEELGRQSDTLLAEQGQPEAALRFADSLKLRLHTDDQQDSLNSSLITHGPDGFEAKQYSISLRDIKRMEPDSLLDAYQVHGFWNRLIVQQWLKLNFETKRFSSTVLGSFIWMVIMMMPALALILKLLYIRRRRYFVEHLVFSFHYHAFAFVVFSVAFLLLCQAEFNTVESDDDINVGLEGHGGLIIAIAFIWTWLYQYLAMRRIYGQGRWKTFFKSSLLNFFYLFVFVFFLVVTFAFTVLTF
jgi:hypothetical protein